MKFKPSQDSINIVETTTIIEVVENPDEQKEEAVTSSKSENKAMDTMRKLYNHLEQMVRFYQFAKMYCEIRAFENSAEYFKCLKKDLKKAMQHTFEYLQIDEITELPNLSFKINNCKELFEHSKKMEEDIVTYLQKLSKFTEDDYELELWMREFNTYSRLKLTRRVAEENKEEFKDCNLKKYTTFLC
jgi:ferritin